MPSRSRNGKRISFKSDWSGNDQVWSISVDGGPAAQIMHDGACKSVCVSCGKLLYDTKACSGSIWTVSVQGGAEKPVPELQCFFSFATRLFRHPTLDKQPIWNFPNVTLSSDGRRLLTVRPNQEVK